MALRIAYMPLTRIVCLAKNHKSIMLGLSAFRRQSAGARGPYRRLMPRNHSAIFGQEACKPQNSIRRYRKPWTTPPDSFAGLRERIDDTLAGLAAIDPAELDSFVGRPMRFELGDYKVDYVAEDFLLSFSIPNFYFHVTTAYDILRSRGVVLGKADYLGRTRGKRAQPA